MGKVSHKSGFTLLEILVVIIIIGVLASSAMPSLFRNVERSRATEALNTMGIIKRSIEGCAAQFNGNGATCNTFVRIGMDDPSNTVVTSSHFNYTIGAPVVTGTACAAVVAGALGGPVENGPTFRIVATRVALDNGTAGDRICLDRTTTAEITRSGTGAFASIQ